jgi:hypothetical protein
MQNSVFPEIIGALLAVSGGQEATMGKLQLAAAMVVVVVAGGCSNRPLGHPVQCSYAFEAPMAGVGAVSGQGQCYFDADGALSLELTSALGHMALGVASSDHDGYARLENAPVSPGSPVSAPYDIYGLVDLFVDGPVLACSDWGGHVRWNEGDADWRVEMVASCALHNAMLKSEVPRGSVYTIAGTITSL